MQRDWPGQGAIRSDVGADDGSNPGAAQFTGQSSGFNIAFFDPSPCCHLAVPGIDPNDDSAWMAAGQFLHQFRVFDRCCAKDDPLEATVEEGFSPFH